METCTTIFQLHGFNTAWQVMASGRSKCHVKAQSETILKLQVDHRKKRAFRKIKLKDKQQTDTDL